MITLCVIARNEEANLPGCLDSVRSVADRIVVVETGSDDRTVEIAEAMGATVVHYPWNDDFSAARNAALPHVSKDENSYILVLDADERLAPGSGKALKHEAARGRLDLGLLTLHNAATPDARAQEVLSGRARHGEPILLPRFVRYTEDLRWEGIIHENVEAWLLRGARKHGRIDASILHYGGIPEQRKAMGKDDRNLRLLRKHCEAHPEDGLMRARLAGELEDAGRTEEALQFAQEAWDIHHADGCSVQMDRDRIMAATVLVFLLTKVGQRREAARVLEQAGAVDTRHPNFDFLRALLCELRYLEDPSHEEPLLEAERALEACIERDGEVFLSPKLPGATSWTAATRLGTVKLLLEKPAEAGKAFSAALAIFPGHREAQLGAAEAMLRSGDARAAIHELEPLLQNADPDSWFLIAQAAAQVGAKEDARLFAKTAARTLLERPFVAIHRKLQLPVLDSLLAA